MAGRYRPCTVILHETPPQPITHYWHQHCIYDDYFTFITRMRRSRTSSFPIHQRGSRTIYCIGLHVTASRLPRTSNINSNQQRLQVAIAKVRCSKDTPSQKIKEKEEKEGKCCIDKVLMQSDAVNRITADEATSLRHNKNGCVEIAERTMGPHRTIATHRRKY